MQQIQTIDIFGNKQSNDNNVSNNKDQVKSKKIFPKIDINIGLNTNQLQNDSILIHRLLQKKLYNNLNQNMQTSSSHAVGQTSSDNKVVQTSSDGIAIHKFIKILINEMKTKKSNYDVSIITRDTLLEYYVVK